jgi:hypothetical protein
MSQKGNEKRMERLHKKAMRAMLVPFEKMSPREQKRWLEGSGRVLKAVREGS